MATSTLGAREVMNSGDNKNAMTLHLLEKLQNAICNGEHEVAADTAGTLARLKVNIGNVTMNPSTSHGINTLNVRIENETNNQEPVSIEINRSMTINELEMKVFDLYKVPIYDQCLVFVKPASVLHEEAAGTSNNEISSLSCEWQCPSCTLINKISEKFCGACNRNRVKDHVILDAENNVEACEWMNKNIEQETLEQKLANYQELVTMELNDLITNLEEFNCSICLTTYFPGDGVILKSCLHVFCRECLAQMIQHSTEAEINCPYKDDDYSCESPLQDREIRALVTAEVYERYLTRSIVEAESKIQNTFHCRTVNCSGWCVVEDDINEFDCPVCENVNCLTCQAIHTKLSCRQYQNLIKQNADNDEEAKKTQLKLEEMLKSGVAMTCPTCSIIIIKKIGCDAITCTMCKTEICWATRGPRWGPKGRGDTSGGCRCGVNRKRCHPKCGNCH